MSVAPRQSVASSQSVSEKAGAGSSAGSVIDSLASRFRRARLHHGHGATDAETEAFWLVAWALKLDFATLDATLEQPVSAAALRRMGTIAEERIATRTPLAYLLGEAWLGPWRFHVDRRVIVPRSFIAPMLMAQMAPWIKRPGSVKRALDLCTGSGCLAIVAAHAFPDAQVDAVDLSGHALQVARRNVKAHVLEERVALHKGNLFAPLAAKRYELIVTNPPYVKATAMARLPAEYRAEPAMALAGGKDGLDLVARIFAQASRHLTPKGLLVMETGHQRAAVERRWPRLPLTWADVADGGIVCLISRDALEAFSVG